MANATPNQNFVGKLGEMCLKLHLSHPEFNVDSSEGSMFMFSCRVGKYSSIGEGYTKKSAKHNAAKKIIDLIENDNIQVVKEKSTKFSDNVVTMLATYCVKKNGGEPPLYAEKPKEDDLFVFECTLKGYTATGKGKNKKTAKERAADLVAHNFGVYEYYKTLGITNERKESLKNPITLVHELAQKKKQGISFSEKNLSINQFVYTCQMGGKTTESSVCNSKKNAKMEAAQMMLYFYSQATDNYLTTPPLSEGGDALSEDEGDRNEIISSAEKKGEDKGDRNEIISSAGKKGEEKGDRNEIISSAGKKGEDEGDRNEIISSAGKKRTRSKKGNNESSSDEEPPSKRSSTSS